jgi:hypothetical protein
MVKTLRDVWYQWYSITPCLSFITGGLSSGKSLSSHDIMLPLTPFILDHVPWKSVPERGIRFSHFSHRRGPSFRAEG